MKLTLVPYTPTLEEREMIDRAREAQERADAENNSGPRGPEPAVPSQELADEIAYRTAICLHGRAAVESALEFWRDTDTTSHTVH